MTLGTGGFPGIHMVGWGGGGVGWGMITFLALAHMVAATQHHLSCTCTHGRCYATSWDGVGWGMITFLALAHMVAATQHQLSCTCTHGRCYATSSFLHLHTLVGDEVWSVMKFVKKDVTHSSWLQVTTVQKAFVQFRKNNWDAPIWILQWCETRLSTLIFWVHTS